MGKERMIAIRTVEHGTENTGNNHTRLAVFMKQPFLGSGSEVRKQSAVRGRTWSK